MQTNFGLSLQNTGWFNQYELDTDLCFSFLSTKFNYIVKNVLKYQVLGIMHMRLPNMVPNEDIKVLENVLKDPRLNIYKNILKTSGLSFSIHSNYKCANLKDSNLKFLVNYYVKLNAVMNFLGINNYYIINHVNTASELEVISTLKQLKRYCFSTINKNICLENCENGYTLLECLNVSVATGNPVIFDNFHNQVKGQFELNNYFITRLKTSWSETALIPKIHFSNGDLVTHKHNSDFRLNELMNILNTLKQVFPNLIVQLEFKYSKEILLNLKYTNLDWGRGFTLTI